MTPNPKPPVTGNNGSPTHLDLDSERPRDQDKTVLVGGPHCLNHHPQRPFSRGGKVVEVRGEPPIVDGSVLVTTPDDVSPPVRHPQVGVVLRTDGVT